MTKSCPGIDPWVLITIRQTTSQETKEAIPISSSENRKRESVTVKQTTAFMALFKEKKGRETVQKVSLSLTHIDTNWDVAEEPS